MKLLQLGQQLSLYSSVESDVLVILQLKSNNALGWVAAEQYLIAGKVKCHEPSLLEETPSLAFLLDLSEKKHFEALSSGIIGFLDSITTLTPGAPTVPAAGWPLRGYSVKPVAPLVQSPVEPASENLRDSSQRWWLAALLFVGMIFGYAQRGALSPVAPYMIKELGLSPAVMGVLLSAFFWVYSFMQMPAGWLVDRYGVRRSYAIGYAFWSTISALTGLANGLVSLIAARVLLGAGQSVAFPASARACGVRQ